MCPISPCRRDELARRDLLVPALLLLVLALTACAPVQPWEKDRLAKTEMALEPDPLEAEIDSHTYFSKEGASGRAGSAGGGCGCN